jgi:phage/plasmid-associated DNA primase
MEIRKFLTAENIVNYPIWYFISDLDGKKNPIGEKNNTTLEQALEKQKLNIIPSKPSSIWKKSKDPLKKYDEIPLSNAEKKSLQLAYSIFLKYTENLYCIDIDDSKINSMEEFISSTGCNIFKNCTWVKGNTKGIHIYLRINNMIEFTNQQDVYKMFKGDLLKKNNVWEKHNKIVYNYSGIMSSFDYEEIKEIFNDRLNPSTPEKNLLKTKVQIIDNNEDIKNNKNENCSIYYNLLVEGLGNKNFNYEYWLKICSWCVSHISKKQFLDYVDSAWKVQAEKMWDSLIQYSTKVPIYLLEKLVKDKNPDFYRNWRIEHKQFLKLKILEKGSNDVACFISKKLKMDLVYCNDSWFMFDKFTSLWRVVKRPDAIITTHIQREIDEARETLLYVKNKLENDEERNKLTKLEKSYLDYYKSVSNGSYCSQIIKFLTEYLFEQDFTKHLDNYKYKIVFKDGILDLKTLEFKKGINQEDFITKTIPFNYQKPKQEQVDFVKLQLKKICNWNDQNLDYYLSTLGYAMTGDSNKEQMFYYLRGQTAENGKSLIFETLEKIMPNYVSKGTSNILDKGVELKKEIPTWKGLLILWLNELSTKIKDEDLVKSLCDGTDYKFGKNYATEAEKIRIGFKLFTVSNNSINVKGDEGIKRRFKLFQFNSQFKDTNVVDNYESLQFVKDKDLGDKLSGEYKYALIYLIFQYSQMYYLEKGLKPYPAEWNEQAIENLEDNDKFKSWFDTNMVVDKNGKIAKKDLVDLLPKEFGDIKIVDELTRMKIPYIYKSQDHIGRKKGVYYGLRTKTEEEMEL